MDSSQSRVLSRHEIELIRLCAENDLFFFINSILRVSDWLHPDIHDSMCEFLMGKSTVKDLMGFRQCFKTTVLSGYIVWESIRDPNVSVMVVSKIVDNAANTIALAKSYWEKNALLRLLYPELVPSSGNKWSDRAATVNRTVERRDPTYSAAGLGSTTTTLHPNIIIYDDAISAEKDDMTGDEAVPSQDSIDQAIGSYKLQETLITDRDHEPGRRINVGTRWAMHDLSDYIRRNEVDLGVYDLPVMRDGKPTFPTKGNGRPHFTMEKIEITRKRMGPYMFNGQYMLDPLSLEKMSFRPELIAQAEYTTLPEMTYNAYICVDPAISKKKGADYSGIAAVLVSPDDHRWVEFATQTKANPFDVASKVLDIYVALKSSKAYEGVVQHIAFVVEATAYQEALCYILNDLAKRRGLVIPKPKEYRPKAQKDLRILALGPYVEQGKLHIKSNLHVLRTELLEWPRGRHEHIADALAQHLAFANKPPGVVEEVVKPNPLSWEVIRKELRQPAGRALDHRYAGAGVLTPRM